MSDEDYLEREAAALWRRENPDMSVFDCDHAMKERYRDRIRDARRDAAMARADPALENPRWRNR